MLRKILLVAWLALAACSPVVTNAQSPAAAPYLVLISLDACRPEYLALASLPHLQELMNSGVTYTDAWVGALVSNTPPGHTEMATGSFPNHNGILSFTWKNSETGETTDPTTLNAINQGEMDGIVAASGVPTLAGLVKAQSPDATVVAISSHKFYAAQGLGIGPSDYIIYAKNAPKQKSTKGKPTPTPERGYEPPAGSLIPAAIVGHEPPADVMNDRRLNVVAANPGDDNNFAINAALVLFEKYRPRALLVNLPATDEQGHKTGGIIAPDIMRQVMVTTDAGIGKLMDAYKAAGIFEQTLWIVTADHGMTPNTYEIDPQTIRNIAKQAGVPGGGLQAYLRNPAQAPKLAEAIAKTGVDGIVGAYAKVKVGDHYEYQSAPATKATLAPALNDAYLYLLSTYVGATSHDLVLTTKENYASKGQYPPNTHGGHGEINWADQHIPLIISGPGIKRGASSSAPARLVDLLPTIAREMNLSATGMDGVPLADALTNPQASDVSAQNAVAARLAPLRDALKQQK